MTNDTLFLAAFSQVILGAQCDLVNEMWQLKKMNLSRKAVKWKKDLKKHIAEEQKLLLDKV